MNSFSYHSTMTFSENQEHIPYANVSKTDSQGAEPVPSVCVSTYLLAENILDGRTPFAS